MNVVLFGATGMIGSGVLLECVRDPRVESILEVGRRTSQVENPKLRKVVHDDFLSYDAIEEELTGHDACFFCLGVSSVGMSEEDYHRITHDFTLAAAEALTLRSPGIVFCYVSGAGTDATGEEGPMWARVKGKTENVLRRLETPTYMFRPGYIQPVKGVRSKTFLYRIAYGITAPLYPLLERFFPDRMTTSEILGRAMIEVAHRKLESSLTAGDESRRSETGFEKEVLETPDINELGRR